MLATSPKRCRSQRRSSVPLVLVRGEQPGPAAPVQSDEALALAAARGDRSAFDVLVARHERRIYSVALGIVRDPDDARDVCQEAFLNAYRGLGGFNGDSRFFTWLYRIVVNLCLDHRRARRHQLVEFDEQVVTHEADPAVLPGARQHDYDPALALDNKELGRTLADALAQLPAEQRTVLALRELGGLSYAEIADQLGWHLGTVMSRLFYARKKMQVLLRSADETLALAA